MLQLTAHQRQRLASENGEERATSTAGFIQPAAETGSKIGEESEAHLLQANSEGWHLKL